MNAVTPDTNTLRHRINARLAELLPAETLPPQNLSRAIRYAALAPGKRLRGIMTLLAAGIRQEGADRALDSACAIEMVHAASLVVDDLPIMDNAAMRRGQPATHRIFGDDTATLTAFALLNRAYGVIAADGALPARLRNEIAVLLHQAIGTQGLIGGQELDLHEDYTTADVASLSDMYQQKTGLLFIAAAEAGARIAGLDCAQIAGVGRFSRYLGLAYQLADDLTDAGEPGAGNPPRDGRTNIVAAIGPERTERLLDNLLEHAVRSLAPLGPAGDPLAALARSMFESRRQGQPTSIQHIANA
jgi:geranylgeranyl diphosphate synthase type II